MGWLPALLMLMERRALGRKPIPLIAYAVACLHLKKKTTDTLLILIVYTLEVYIPETRFMSD